MSQPKVSFTIGSGGLGRPLTGTDHYSAMIAYDYGSAATSAYSGIGDAIYTSIKDAEADGVVSTCAEATAATSDQTVTGTGADGDTVNLVAPKWDGTTVDLGTYTKVTADNTVTLVATGIIAAINAKTYIHGFTAAAGAAGHYIITAPKTWGVYLNTLSTTNTITGTVAITNAAFAGGTKSQLALYHYQISEFFRGNPLGILYFSIKWDDSAQSVTLFNTQLQANGLSVQNAFDGQAKRILFYNPGRTFATSTLTACKALATTLLAQYTPATMWYCGKNTGSLSAQANTRALSADGCTAIIGQSGSGVGVELSYTQQTVIGAAGLAIGIKSAGAVSQNIGEVQAFNLSDGAECEIAHFFDRTVYKTISTTLGDQLHDYGYVFLRTIPGVSGVYFNSDPAAVSPTSDFAYMSASETMNKAIRGVYTNIVKLLNSRLSTNADGTLSEVAIAAFQEKSEAPLAQMEREGDIAGNDSGEKGYQVLIDRTAVVTSTGIVPINIGIVPVGMTRQISITIGFRATI
jgi:hypothetical protein